MARYDPHKLPDDPGVDPNAPRYGVGGMGGARHADQYAGVASRTGALDSRTAQGVGAGEWGAGRGARGLLRSAAEGKTPSAAEMMFQRGAETAQRGAMAGMATGRGGAGLMQMGAVQGQGQAVMGAAGQAAQLRAQEMAQARGQYMQGATALGQLGLSEAEQFNRMRQFMDDQVSRLMLGGMSRDAAIAQAQNQAYMNEQQLGTDRFLGKMDDRSTREIAELENTGMLGDTISLTTGKKKTGFGGRGSFLDFRTQAKKAKRGLYDIFSAPFGDGEEQYEEAPYRIGAPEFTSKYPETKGASLHGDTSPSMASNISKGREHPITGETKGHQGRDFGVPQGTKLIAPFDGVVSRVGSLEGGPGRYIAIKKKGDSREAKIFHMSKISLNPGTKIKKGETVLGLSGGTPGTKGAGSSTGPHTHVEWWDKAEKESRNVYPPLGADYQGTFVPGANKGVLLDIQDMPGVIPREAKKQEQVAQAKKPKATTVESASYGTGGALGPPAPTANPMQGLLNEVVDSTPGMQNWLNNQEEERERRKEFLGLHEQAAAAQEEALSPGAQNAITYGSTETEPGVGTLPPADSWEEDPRTGKYIPSYSIAQKAPDDPLADQIKEGFGNIGLREAGLAAGAIFGGEEGRREGAQALGGNLGGMAGGALAASINPALAPVGKFVGTALGSKLGGETMGSGGKHYESRKEGRKRPQRTRIALSAPYGSLSGYYSRMRGE